MDAALEAVGDWGAFQKRRYSLLCLQFLATGMVLYTILYSLAEQKHRCKIDMGDMEYYTQSSLYNQSVRTKIPVDQYGEYSPCYKYVNETVTELEPCSSLVYDTSEIENTLVSQFDLVCSKRVIASAVATASLFGRCIGSIATGILADKYGRKATLVVATAGQLLFSLLSIAPNTYSYLLFRLLTMCCSSGAYETAYIMALEIVCPSRRILLSAFASLVYTVGYFIDTAAMYLLRDWQFLTIFSAVLLVPLPFIFMRWVPESPRWLLSMGNIDAAKEILYDMAICNGRKLSKDQLCTTNNIGLAKSSEKPSFRVLLRSSTIRNRVLLFFFMWFAVNMAYYGLPLQSSYLFGGIYLNHVLNATADLPVFFMIYVSTYLGRKKTAFLSLGSGSAGLFTAGIISIYFRSNTGAGYGTMIGFALGKFGAAAAYNELFMWTAETMPTIYRNMILGFCSAVSGIGSAVSPFVIQMDADKSHSSQGVPSLIFACALAASCLATIPIPETNNKCLPETIVEAEQLGKAKNSDYKPLP